jgi:hypothetical protein
VAVDNPKRSLGRDGFDRVLASCVFDVDLVQDDGLNITA